MSGSFCREECAFSSETDGFAACHVKAWLGSRRAKHASKLTYGSQEKEWDSPYEKQPMASERPFRATADLKFCEEFSTRSETLSWLRSEGLDAAESEDNCDVLVAREAVPENVRLKRGGLLIARRNF